MHVKLVARGSLDWARAPGTVTSGARSSGPPNGHRHQILRLWVSPDHADHRAGS